MAGMRPLTKAEINLTFNELASLRDKALFILGIKSGFRITELLSMPLSMLYQHGKIVDRVTVERKSMKGKITSRDVILHSEAKRVLLEYIETVLIPVHGKGILKDKFFPLFPSRQKDKYGNIKALDRRMAWVILKNAFSGAELTGRLATHSMRKTFCKDTHKKLGGDIRQTQVAMGHSDPKTTMEYLPPDQDAIDAAILSDNEE